MQDVVLELKSLVRRALGIPDPWKHFRDFQKRIHPGTWACQEAVYRWLDQVVQNPSGSGAEGSADPVVRRGHELRERVLRDFKDRYKNRSGVRVLLPGYSFSIAPGGYSLFRNLADGLEWLGLPAAWWDRTQDLARVLDASRPTVFLADEPEEYVAERYLQHIDLRALEEYRKSRPLKFGLVASPYPKEPAALDARLRHARRLGVDFYYCFQAPAFSARVHASYRRHGYHVCSLEFGANPLVFYPAAGVTRDLNFVFLGSTHFEKWERYRLYFKDLLSAVPGFIAGPGWRNAAREKLPDAWLRWLYARAKVGLNLHVPFQMEGACEVNERTYNLAAAGVPQLVDRPKLLPERFALDSLYSATSPQEYRDMFGRILARPEEARERAQRALEQVLTRYTVFHRAEGFVRDLTEHVLAG